MLRELARRGGLHQAATQAAREAHPFALHVGAGCLEQFQRLGVVAKVNAGFFQDGVGVAFDDLQALFVEHLVIRNFPSDVGRRLAAAGGARCALGFAPATGPPATGDLCFCCCFSHTISPEGSWARDVSHITHSMVRPSPSL